MRALTELEASILSRSRRAHESAKPYQPSVTTGERVRILRRAAGLTLEQLAKRANMTRGSLSSTERSKRPLGLQVLRWISIGRLDLIASKMFAYCDRNQDLPDMVKLKPTRDELDGIYAWVLERDASELWPKRVDECFSKLRRKLGHE